MNDQTRIDKTRHRLTTPRAAAVAGIISGALLIAVNFLLRLNISFDPAQPSAVLVEKAASLSLAVRLVPFAGIAFLWFIGVARDRLGEWEDKFFSTVFLGSGLLYLAVTFMATAMAGGILHTYPRLEPAMGEALFKFTQSILAQLNHILGMRMAAVFMLSSATMWQRTGVMPRWLALLTYLLALGLLVLVNFSLWAALAFPVWMVAVSTLILIYNYRHTAENKVEPALSER